MATERRVSYLITANTKDFAKGLNKASAKFKRFGRKLKRTGRSLSRNITLPLAAIGGASIKMAADFEKSMTKIETLVGLSRSEVSGMKDEVKALAKETGKGPKELADALFFITSAGLRGKEALNALERSAKSAAIGLGETKNVADAVTSVMNAYGSESTSAARATDTLLGIVRAGKVEAETLAPAIGKVIPLASQLGISFEEVGASMATFTKVGADASEAATGLRGVMAALVKPTKQGKKALADVGLTFKDLRAQVRDKGLATTLIDLYKAFDGNTESLTKVIPRVRALTSFLGTAATQGDTYKQVLKDIQNATGEVDEGFERVSQTTSQKFNRALSNLKTAGIEIGAKLLPTFNKLVGGISDIATWFSNLTDTAQNTIMIISGVAAAVGPLVWIFGSLSTVMGAIVSVGGTLATIFGALWSPIGAVIVGVGALIVAGKSLYDNWDYVVVKLKKIWEGLKLAFWMVVKGIVDAYAWMFQSILTGLAKLAARFAPSALSGIAKLSGMISEATEGIDEKVNKAGKAFRDAAVKEAKMRGETVSLSESFNSLKDGITDTFSNLLKYIGLTGKATEATNKLTAAQLKQKRQSEFGKGPGKATLDKPDYTKDEAGYGDLQKAAPNGDGRSASEVATGKSEEEMNRLQKVQERMAKGAARVQQAVNASVANMASNFAAGIGKMMAGTQSLGGVFRGILTMLADLAIRVGKIAIATGIAIKGIKEALKSLNPVVAIAAGVALIALGSWAKSALSKAADKGSGGSSGGSSRPRGAGVPGMADGGIVPDGFPNDTYPAMLTSGEMVVPSPKKLPTGGSGGSQNVNVSGQFRVKGTDLVLVLEKAKQTLR